MALCNTSLSTTNASGIFTYPVPYPLPENLKVDSLKTEYVPDPSWAITVTGGNGEEVLRSLYYSTSGQNYSADLKIGYDVCAFVISRLPINAIQLGQSDNGNCSTMFTERCINNMTSTVSKSAEMWTTYTSPPPYQNLTAGVLPSICSYVYRDLRNTMLTECGPEFGLNETESTIGAVINQQAPTGYNDSILYDDTCPPSTMGNKTFHRVRVPIEPTYQDWRTGTDVGYDNATHDILPVLTVYLPVANVERTSFYSVSPSVLQCLRASNYSEGTRVSPALAEGTPWPKPAADKGLSVGAKGGIAAGVVIAVLAIGALCLRFIKQKRRK